MDKRNDLRSNLPASDTEAQPSPDGIDRRGFLKCMAWVGAGVVWSVNGGVLSSRTFGEPAAAAPATSAARGDFTFVQISDSHIGFSKEPNRDVAATLRLAVDHINALPKRPDLLIHTGDLTHLAKPEEFDAVAQIVKGAKVGSSFYVPGEHDVFTNQGKLYLDRYGKGTHGSGWQSFDHRGVHFIGLVNVADLKPGGLGVLGRDQLDWLRKDVESLAASTPIVLFAHVPLWTVYPKWGWGTDDGAAALGLLRRFGSVTVLNGHIHQVLQKVEGNITFHTARSTAFPQPEPGKAESPGPMKNVAAERLRSMLGITSVNYAERTGALAVVDQALA
jgi:3',5'-cyclic-AMP phosphodiesterase